MSHKIDKSPPADIQQQANYLGYSNEETSGLWDAFNFCDENGTGLLNLSQVDRVLQCYHQNPSKAQVENAFTGAQTDSDGCVTFVEFLKHAKPLILTRDQMLDNLRRAFMVFDKSNMGVVSKEKMREVLLSRGETLPQEDIDQLFSQVEADEEGLVNYEDIIQFLVPPAVNGEQ